MNFQTGDKSGGPGRVRPQWLRWLGLASIVVAVGQMATAAWYLDNVYSQLLRSEVAMLFAAAIAGAPPVAAGPGSYSAGNQPRPAERPASPEPLGGCGPFGHGPITLRWNVIVPTIVVWACAVGLSMLALLGAGVLAVLGSRWARGVHLVAAGLTLGATIVTLVSLAVLVKYAGAQSWSSARYALVAGVQSGWGWVLLLIFAGRARSGLAGQG